MKYALMSHVCIKLIKILHVLLVHFGLAITTIITILILLVSNFHILEMLVYCSTILFVCLFVCCFPCEFHGMVQRAIIQNKMITSSKVPYLFSLSELYYDYMKEKYTNKNTHTFLLFSFIFFALSYSYVPPHTLK